MSLHDFQFPSATGVPEARIVNGTEVFPPFKYPTMVSLQVNGTQACGGSLYKDDTVITAAHCTIFNIQDWTAKVHRHDLRKSDSEEGGKTYRIKSRVAHPTWSKEIAGYDVAIWKLEGVGSSKRTSLTLDYGHYGYPTGRLLKSIGWGLTSETANDTSPTLQEVSLPIYDPKKCKANYVGTRYKVDGALQVCAGYDEGGRDACNGDSGGPLLAFSGSSKPVLVGITSFGNGCAAPKYPGVYTRVSSLLDWIQAHV